MKIPTLLCSFITDKQGKVAILQAPNVPLMGWVVLTLLTHVAQSDHLKNGFGFLATAFLFTWSYMELHAGASYFRRALGLLVLTGIVINHF